MPFGLSLQPVPMKAQSANFLGSGDPLRPAPLYNLTACPPLALPILTAHLRQLEESGLKAGMPPVGVGYQRDKEDVLGGEESQVVGGRVGATQPARQRNEVSDKTFH